MHRRICSLLLILVLVCAAALPVWAHEVPDTARLGSIAISMTHQGEPVPGGSLTLYRVADVISSDGDYLFAAYKMPVADPENPPVLRIFRLQPNE